MSLRRRLVAVLVLVGLLAGLGFAVCGLTLAAMVRDQDRVTGRYFEAVRLASEHLLAQVDQETGLRGFELSGDGQFLLPYESGITVEKSSYDELRVLLSDEPDLLAALEISRAAGQTWRSEYAETRLALVQREGRIPFSRGELEEGRVRFDAVRNASVTFTNQILERRDNASADLRRATRLLAWVLGIAAAFTLLAGLLLWWAVRRWVTTPLVSLGAQVSKVEEGNFDRPITPVGPAEISELAVDVESMRQRVVSQYAAAVQARSEVEAASRMVQEQAVELRRSNRDLEQFAYVASHDLQEPLRKVSSFCQMLEKRYKGQLDERADQYISFAVDGAARMQVLINDLLRFSRVGRNTAAFTEVDLQDCFAQALRVLEGPIREAGATVSADPLPVVSGEASLLTQLFQNLIGNAVKFRSAQAPVVHLSVATAPAQDGEGESWQMTCADNGIGIDPQYADKIFVIFQRLHPKEDYTGTGIGLALCKKIVEYHGGRIWLAESGEGEEPALGGTTFAWTLPKAVSSGAPENAERLDLLTSSSPGHAVAPPNPHMSPVTGASV